MKQMLKKLLGKEIVRKERSHFHATTNPLYIYMNAHHQVHHTRALSGDVVIDYNERGEVIGVEILNYAEIFENGKRVKLKEAEK